MRTVSLAIVCLSLAAGTAGAEPRVLADARVKLETPASWKIEESGRVLTMTAPAQEASFIVQVLDAPNQEAMEKALQTGDAFIAKIATDVKWAGKPQERRVNGMRGLSNKAT